MAKDEDGPVQERKVRIIQAKDKKKLQKEIQGLRARAKWTHLGPAFQKECELKAQALEQELKAEDE